MFFSHGTASSCGVAISYFGTKSFKVQDILGDKNSYLPLLDAKIDDQNFEWRNFYNANMEKEQLSTLIEPKNMLNNVNNIYTKQIILSVDLEAKGDNPAF